MTKVAVLGASGMLGSMVTRVLAGDEGFSVTATARDDRAIGLFSKGLSAARWVSLDARAEDLEAELDVLEGNMWVVNAIGITKPLVHDDNAEEVERAVMVNSLFPQALGKLAERTGARVLQIATDCAYSGAKGAYTEKDAHDALDVYGKTKSLGEVWRPRVNHLRCSIIGPEPKDHKFLLDWFLGQAKGASVNGFTNHLWNGVTTFHFAKICAGIIKNGMELPHLQHIVPGNALAKAAMLDEFARCYGRTDIIVNKVEAAQVIDRTLGTVNQELNLKIWKAAGYDPPPTVQEMISEMSHFSAPGR